MTHSDAPPQIRGHAQRVTRLLWVLAIIASSAALIRHDGWLSRVTRKLGIDPPASRSPEGLIDRALFDSLTHGGHRVGIAEAKLPIVIFGAYGCGYCAKFNATLDSLRNAFPTDVAVVWYSFLPSQNRETLTWHLAAECAADQRRFPEFHALLFRHLTLATQGEGWMTLGDSAGIPDRATFYDCVRREADLARINADTRLGRSIGVRATPTFVVAGQVVEGARPYPALLRVVESLSSATRRRERITGSSGDATRVVE